MKEGIEFNCVVCPLCGRSKTADKLEECRCLTPTVRWTQALKQPPNPPDKKEE